MKLSPLYIFTIFMSLNGKADISETEKNELKALSCNSPVADSQQHTLWAKYIKRAKEKKEYEVLRSLFSKQGKMDASCATQYSLDLFDIFQAAPTFFLSSLNQYHQGDLRKFSSVFNNEMQDISKDDLNKVLKNIPRSVRDEKLIKSFKEALSLDSKLTVHECSDKATLQDFFISVAMNKFQVGDDEKGPLTKREDLENAIEILDKKNGYLQLQNKTIISLITATIFKRKNKKTLAITEDGISVQNKYSFECHKGKIVETTKTFYPELTYERIAELYKSKKIKIGDKFPSPEDLKQPAHSIIRFKLPRRGRKIEIYASHPDLNENISIFSFTPSI